MLSFHKKVNITTCVLDQQHHAGVTSTCTRCAWKTSKCERCRFGSSPRSQLFFAHRSHCSSLMSQMRKISHFLGEYIVSYSLKMGWNFRIFLSFGAVAVCNAIHSSFSLFMCAFIHFGVTILALRVSMLDSAIFRAVLSVFPILVAINFMIQREAHFLIFDVLSSCARLPVPPHLAFFLGLLL